MMPPANEKQRLLAVRRYEILDTPTDRVFDRITSIAARLVAVPISIISIVDSDRIWFKSHHGTDLDQVDRATGLCSSAIVQDGSLVINDALRDRRTFANPLVVGEFGLRFYAGAPLTTPQGFKLGTLAVIDKAPRAISDDHLAILQELADIVVDELEFRLSARSTIGRLEAEVRTDPLTGLPNRRHFDDWMTSPIGRGRRADAPLWLAIIDIDCFKQINDSFGHLAGDTVLKETAQFIQACLPSTSFVVRWGGDEFMVVIAGTASKARRVLATVQAGLAERSSGIIPATVSVSIGATEFRADTDHVAIQRADGALYEAKKTGRGRVVFL